MELGGVGCIRHSIVILIFFLYLYNRQPLHCSYRDGAYELQKRNIVKWRVIGEVHSDFLIS